MCKVMEEMILEERIEFALRMLKAEKFSLQEIAAFSRLPLEEVQRLAAQHPKN